MQLSANQLLAVFDADRASWFDVRHYPSALTCRLICDLADAASVDALWWQIIRTDFILAGVDNSDLAGLLRLPLNTVANAGRCTFTVPANVAADPFAAADDPFRRTSPSLVDSRMCSVSDSMLDPSNIYDYNTLKETSPETSSTHEADVRLSVTCQRAIMLADYAAHNPEHWRIIHAHYQAPKLSAADLAALLGLPERTVCRLLKQPITLTADDAPTDDYDDFDFNNYTTQNYGD